MGQELPHRRGFESLKKEAKRWLAALRANAAGARARLERALPGAPSPRLRDVQHALARELGFSGWAALKAAIAANREAGARALGRVEAAAEALLEAYRTGTSAAMERHYGYTWHRRAWPAMRTYVQLDLGKRPAGPDDDVEITLDDARHLVAIEHGFESWDDLRAFTRSAEPGSLVVAKPVRLEDPEGAEDARPISVSRDWSV